MKTIKMRINKKSHSKCIVCGNTNKNSLEIYDIAIGDKMVTICDLCNDQLFRKTLKATVMLQGRLKDKHDMAIIRKRNMMLKPSMSINQALDKDTETDKKKKKKK